MEKIIALNDLRQKMGFYSEQIKKGASFIVVKKSRPLFKLSPVEDSEEDWETLIDFTQVKKGGVNIKEILKRL